MGEKWFVIGNAMNFGSGSDFNEAMHNALDYANGKMTQCHIYRVKGDNASEAHVDEVMGGVDYFLPDTCEKATNINVKELSAAFETYKEILGSVEYQDEVFKVFYPEPAETPEQETSVLGLTKPTFEQD